MGQGEYSQADLELPEGALLTSISIGAAGTNDSPVHVAGCVGPEDCKLVRLSPGESVGWSCPEGFTGDAFTCLTLGPNTEGTPVDEYVEISYTICLPGET